MDFIVFFTFYQSIFDHSLLTSDHFWRSRPLFVLGFSPHMSDLFGPNTEAVRYVNFSPVMVLNRQFIMTGVYICFELVAFLDYFLHATCSTWWLCEATRGAFGVGGGGVRAFFCQADGITPGVKPHRHCGLAQQQASSSSPGQDFYLDPKQVSGGEEPLPSCWIQNGIRGDPLFCIFFWICDMPLFWLELSGRTLGTLKVNYGSPWWSCSSIIRFIKIQFNPPQGRGEVRRNWWMTSFCQRHLPRKLSAMIPLLTQRIFLSFEYEFFLRAQAPM